MQSLQENAIIELVLQSKKPLTFLEGLAGFEDILDYFLITNLGQQPLILLQAAKVENLSFLVADPFLFYSDYKPKFPENMPLELQVAEEGDPLLLCFMTFPSPDVSQATINLAAPLVINLEKGIGKQMQLLNFNDYSLEVPV